MDYLLNTELAQQFLGYGRDYLLGQLGAALGAIDTTTLIILLLLGGCSCFLGYRLMKLWLFLIGGAAGCVLGYLLGMQFTESRTLAVVIAVIAAAACGGLSYWIYQAGVFLLCFIGGTLGFSFLLRPTTSLFFFGCMLLGAAIGVAGVKFVKPIVILVTSAAGGVAMGSAIAGYMGMNGFTPGLLLGGILALAGFLVQWLTSPKDRRKEEDEDGEETDRKEYNRETSISDDEMYEEALRASEAEAQKQKARRDSYWKQRESSAGRTGKNKNSGSRSKGTGSQKKKTRQEEGKWEKK